MPRCVSVTRNVTATLVNPAAKTQYRWLNEQPFTTLTIASTLFGLKNQNMPVSDVCGRAVADPVRPSDVAQSIWTRKRPPLTQSVDVTSSVARARLELFRLLRNQE